VRDARQQTGREYEPYFTPSPLFEGDEVLARLGVSTLTLFDAVGRVVEVMTPDGARALNAYHAWSQVVSDPNDAVSGSAWQIARQALPVTSDEGRARAHAESHANTPRVRHLDAAGRVVMDLEQGGTTATARRTETLWGDDGEPVGLIDPRGLSDHRARRDLSGRVVLRDGNDAGATRSTYDAAGRAVRITDARGVTRAITYDTLDRIRFVDVIEAGQPSLRVEEHIWGEAEPDAARRGLRGRLAMMHDGAGEWRALDRYPRGATHRWTRRLADASAGSPNWGGPVALDDVGLETLEVVDAIDRAVERRPPDGTIHRWWYGRAGRLMHATVGSATALFAERTVASEVVHDERGRRTQIRLGTRLALATIYDRWSGRVRSVTGTRTAVAGSAARGIYDARYTYDAVGNIVRMVDRAQEPGVTHPVLTGVSVTTQRDLTYDAHYRLVGASGRAHQALTRPISWRGTAHLSLDNAAAVERYARSYAYDAAGNLTSMVHSADSGTWSLDYWVSPLSNRSTLAEALDGTPLTNPEARFDDAGHMLVLDHLRRIEWSWAGTLARAVVIDRAGAAPNDEETYAYDAVGQRTRTRSQRLVSGQLEVTERVYLGAAERKRVWLGAVLQLDRWTSHLADGAERIGVLHHWTVDENARETATVSDIRLRYHVRGEARSIAIQVTEAGEVASYEEYLPYGGTAFAAASSPRENATRDRTFAGRDRDALTGLSDFGRRYYCSWLCRWMSPDPTAPADGPNAYAFAGDDPIGNIDPDGLQTVSGKRTEAVQCTPEDEAVPACMPEDAGPSAVAARPPIFHRLDRIPEGEQAKPGNTYLFPIEEPDGLYQYHGWVRANEDRTLDTSEVRILREDREWWLKRAGGREGVADLLHSSAVSVNRDIVAQMAAGETPSDARRTVNETNNRNFVLTVNAAATITMASGATFAMAAAGSQLVQSTAASATGALGGMESARAVNAAKEVRTVEQSAEAETAASAASSRTAGALDDVATVGEAKATAAKSAEASSVGGAAAEAPAAAESVAAPIKAVDQGAAASAGKPGASAGAQSQAEAGAAVNRAAPALRPPRRPADILVDSDVIAHAMKGDAAALAFLRKYAGRTGITGRSVGEVMKGAVPRREVEAFMAQQDVAFVRSRGAAGRAVAKELERPGDTHRSDHILLGTAQSRGMSFVTYGDGRSMSAAIRLRIEARIVVPNASAVRKIENALQGKGRASDYFISSGKDL